MKVCSQCKIELSDDKFYVKSIIRSGIKRRFSRCIDCCNKNSREKYSKKERPIAKEYRDMFTQGGYIYF